MIRAASMREVCCVSFVTPQSLLHGEPPLRPNRYRRDALLPPYFACGFVGQACISRCVRRAFLSGKDDASGRNFDHRKDWVVELLASLTTNFAIRICAYAVLSNHFHLVLRIESESARNWSDDEVVRRYCRLFRGANDPRKHFAPDRAAGRIRCWRARLADLSWFMRCLNGTAHFTHACRKDTVTPLGTELRSYRSLAWDCGAGLNSAKWSGGLHLRVGPDKGVAQPEQTSDRLRAGWHRLQRPNGVVDSRRRTQRRGGPMGHHRPRRCGNRPRRRPHVQADRRKWVSNSVDLGAPSDEERDNAIRGGTMKNEYDFSKGERGKFFRPDAELHMPIYLEPDAAAFLRKVAESKGTDVQQIVNDLIRRDIDLIKSVG